MATGVVSGAVADLLPSATASYPRSSEGATDEDGVQDISAIEQCVTIPRQKLPIRANTTSSRSARGILDIAAALSSTDLANGTRCLRSRTTTRVRATFL